MTKDVKGSWNANMYVGTALNNLLLLIRRRLVVAYWKGSASR